MQEFRCYFCNKKLADVDNLNTAKVFIKCWNCKRINCSDKSLTEGLDSSTLEKRVAKTTSK